MSNPTLENEVREMRATIARLQDELAQLGATQANIAFPKYVRPAMTWSVEEDEETPVNYPDTEVTTSFPFRFCDGEFSPRTAGVDGNAYYAKGIHLPRETKLIVLETKGKFLIVEAFHPCERMFATVKTAFSPGTSSLTFSTYFELPQPCDGILPDNYTSQEVENRFQWPGEDGWLAELMFDHAGQVWYLAQMYCDLS